MKDQELAFLKFISIELQKESFAAEVVGRTLITKKDGFRVALFYRDKKLWMSTQVGKKWKVFRWMRGEYQWEYDTNPWGLVRLIPKEHLGNEEFTVREIMQCLDGLLEVAKEKEKALQEVKVIAS